MSFESCWSEYHLPSHRVILLFYIPNRCVCVDQGKGVPDVNSRLMVRKLWDTLHIPIFALVDGDPHGTHYLSECKPVSPLMRASHISTHFTALFSSLRTHLPLSRQMLAPVRHVMVPRLAVISAGVISSRHDGSVSILLALLFFSIAWQDTYVTLYFVLSSVTHFGG